MKSKITTIDNEICWNDRPVRFFKKMNTDIYFQGSEIDVSQTDCGWNFKISVDVPCVVGIMIPLSPYEIIIGDDLPVDLYRSKQYYYAQDRALERLLNINLADINPISMPIAHFIKDDVACSWSCPNECLISTFVAQSQWHLNFEVWAHKDLTFFMDESSNFLVNLQRYPADRQDTLINKTTGIKTMQRALLSGNKPRKHPNHPHDTIRKARGIQLELSKHKVDSVIIGSLARRLNAIAVDINDIDLMVLNNEDMSKAIDVLGSIADPVQETKFLHLDHTIDLCYDNYNILPGKNYITTRHGLTYLSPEGLLWLYMINLFATEIDEHSDSYKDHIINAIISIQRSCPNGEFNILPYAKAVKDFSPVVYDLCDMMSGATLEYRDIRINKPFSIRCFKKDKVYLYPIANFGSRCDAEVVVEIIPQSAVWKTIDKTVDVKIVPHSNFSVINIPDVQQLGLLKCAIS